MKTAEIFKISAVNENQGQPLFPPECARIRRHIGVGDGMHLFGAKFGVASMAHLAGLNLIAAPGIVRSRVIGLEFGVSLGRIGIMAGKASQP